MFMDPKFLAWSPLIVREYMEGSHARSEFAVEDDCITLDDAIRGSPGLGFWFLIANLSLSSSRGARRNDLRGFSQRLLFGGEGQERKFIKHWGFQETRKRLQKFPYGKERGRTSAGSLAIYWIT